MKLFMPISVATSGAALLLATFGNDQPKQSEFTFTLEDVESVPIEIRESVSSGTTQLLRIETLDDQGVPKLIPKADQSDVELIGEWTWPGDGSPQALAKHMEEFHGEETDNVPFGQMVATHNAIHDEIGPVSFDQNGNASGPGIGTVIAGPISNEGYRSNGSRNSGRGSNGSSSYRPPSQSWYSNNRNNAFRSSYGSQGGGIRNRAYQSNRQIGWRVRRLFGRRGYGSRG